MKCRRGPTILLDLFLTNQRRKRMVEAALARTELPAEDYPLYVLVGAEGPWTPTGLAPRLEMPLSTMLFRLGRLERRGHAERVPNPDDRPVVPDPPHEGGGAAARRGARPRSATTPKRSRDGSARERIDALRAGLEELARRSQRRARARVG